MKLKKIFVKAAQRGAFLIDRHNGNYIKWTVLEDSDFEFEGLIILILGFVIASIALLPFAELLFR